MPKKKPLLHNPKKATITQFYDGWRIVVDNRHYTYNTDHEDLGVGALAVLLSDLGLEVQTEEEY